MGLLDFLKNKEDVPEATQAVGKLPEENSAETEPVSTDAITVDHIKRANDILQKYKSAKSKTEQRIVDNEKIWKMQQWELYKESKKKQLKPATANLWNAVVNKHADYIDGYPSPNFVPRMEDDVYEAKKLSAIIPVILEQNDFRQVYDDCVWYKIKQGCAVYGIFWDSTKDNSLGDIDIKKIDLLKIFWEPGIENIQDSSNVFIVELMNKDTLRSMYPDLPEKLDSDKKLITKYAYDDNVDVDNENKVLVVDWYYKKLVNGKQVLHYVKYTGNNILYASENDTEPGVKQTAMGMVQTPSRAETGWYAHGKYPLVFDSCFDIEGSPAGYGYLDIGKDTLHQIDLMSQAILTNTIVNSKPRHYLRENAGVNEEEFADIDNDIIHISNSGIINDAVQTVPVPVLQSMSVTYLQEKVEELKEITGNRDINNGGATSGITAASAVAALQESGGKQSKAGISGTYYAFKQICIQIIELIREFYNQQHEFRILSDGGQEMFITYTNEGIVPQYQGVLGGVDLGYRTPIFDIEVTAEKASPYKRMERNELAIQLYQLGVFAPQNVDQAVMLLQTMDFADKDKILDSVRKRGDMYQRMTQYANIALSLAAKYEPETANQLAAIIESEGGAVPTANPMTESKVEGVTNEKQEPAHVEKARQTAEESTQPN